MVKPAEAYREIIEQQVEHGDTIIALLRGTGSTASAPRAKGASVLVILTLAGRNIYLVTPHEKQRWVTKLHLRDITEIRARRTIFGGELRITTDGASVPFTRTFIVKRKDAQAFVETVQKAR